MRRRIKASIEETCAAFASLSADDGLQQEIGQAAELCVQRLKAGSKIMFCGNGGSAADAQHLAGELVSRFIYDRPGLAAFALTTDTSVLTAIGNDYGYERIFARQLEAVGGSGDVLVAMSTSGRSPNILAAVDAATKKGIHTIGMTGQSGGMLAGRTELLIRAPSEKTPRIQEVHIAVGHIMCGLIEEAIFPK